MLIDDRQSAAFGAEPGVFARIATVTRVNSRHARGRACSEFLFCTGNFRSLTARLVRTLGCFRRRADALTTGSPLSPYRFAHLGNPYGTASVAMSPNPAGELAGRQS